MLLCAREIFRFFCGTLQIRWRQLFWASIAVRENCLENSQVIEMIQKIKCKIKGIPQNLLEQAWAK
jgi:hypothetical protein